MKLQVPLEDVLNHIASHLYAPMHGFGGPDDPFVVDVLPLLDRLRELAGISREDMTKLYDMARFDAYYSEHVKDLNLPPVGSTEYQVLLEQFGYWLQYPTNDSPEKFIALYLDNRLEFANALGLKHRLREGDSDE